MGSLLSDDYKLTRDKIKVLEFAEQKGLAIGKASQATVGSQDNGEPLASKADWLLGNRTFLST